MTQQCPCITLLHNTILCSTLAASDSAMPLRRTAQPHTTMLCLHVALRHSVSQDYALAMPDLTMLSHHVIAPHQATRRSAFVSPHHVEPCPCVTPPDLTTPLCHTAPTAPYHTSPDYAFASHCLIASHHTMPSRCPTAPDYTMLLHRLALPCPHHTALCTAIRRTALTPHGFASTLLLFSSHCCAYARHDLVTLRPCCALLCLAHAMLHSIMYHCNSAMRSDSLQRQYLALRHPASLWHWTDILCHDTTQRGSTELRYSTA